jgi:hypothetical protein
LAVENIFTGLFSDVTESDIEHHDRGTEKKQEE